MDDMTNQSLYFLPSVNKAVERGDEEETKKFVGTLKQLFLDENRLFKEPCLFC
jgi:hypothetical protein